MFALFGGLIPDRVAIDIGFIVVYWYGLFITLAIIVSLLVAQRYFRRSGLTRVDAYDLALWVVPAAIIGARLWHVFIFQWEYYAAHLNEILRIWEGGIAIHGSLVGGFLAVVLYARRRGVRIAQLTDCISIALPLGQAIGRWGNYFNQELYGTPARLPWSVFITPENRVPGYEAYDFFHPTFLYESILNLLLFFLLLRVGPSRIGSGKVTALYIMGYGLIRFAIDFVRIDPMPMLAGLRYSQYISLLLVAAGVGFLAYKNKKTAHQWRDGGDSNPRPPA